jgi:hypothetical protein
VLYAFGVGPLVQFFVRVTPDRLLAVSGWASIAQAGDLGTKRSDGRTKSHTNRLTTIGECQSPKEMQPTPTC